jgi:energy-coupling factor transporter transmembrane protein EcfT
METAEIPENNYYLLIIQNILISVLSGLALACYVMNDNKQNSILLISILLFVMLQFIVFVEKYLLINEYASIFRPIAMTFNVLAFYSLYKYVIVAEKSNHN